MKIVKCSSRAFGNAGDLQVVLTCPECGKGGTFDKFHKDYIDRKPSNSNIIVGQRV
jgi:uncharacterized protein (DUF983 family)